MEQDQRHFPDWVHQTPLMLFIHGSFWVVVFFILSGFVLPLNFFKTGRETCITGGTFRRYLRLMLPNLMIISLYYLFAKMDWFGQDTYKKIKDRSFGDFLECQLFATWYGDNSWATATWTMSVELFATFFIYLIAQTAVKYRGRFWIYFFACMFVFIPQATDYLDKRPSKNFIYKLGNIALNMPVFFFGVMFADIETWKDFRPLDSVRELHWGWKIPINTVIIAIIVSYGSYWDTGMCLSVGDGNCEFWRYVSFEWQMPVPVAHYLAANLLIFLALTSQAFQWVLGSLPFKFMGRISFSLYLVHELFTDGIMIDSYYYFIGQGYNAQDALWIIFAIYTPTLIVVAWILTLIVDEPSKNWANSLDVQSRIKRPPPRDTDESEDEYYGCWSFTKRSWFIVGFASWLVLLVIVTETYQALRTPPEHYESEIPK